MEPLLVQLKTEVGNKAYDEEDADAASVDRVEGRMAFVGQLDRDAEQVAAPDHISHFFQKFRHLCYSMQYLFFIKSWFLFA